MLQRSIVFFTDSSHKPVSTFARIEKPATPAVGPAPMEENVDDVLHVTSITMAMADWRMIF